MLAIFRRHLVCLHFKPMAVNTMFGSSGNQSDPQNSTQWLGTHSQ